MSFFSNLFKPKPKSPYPIKGRDDEFKATIIFYYQQELGRNPDSSGMASYLHAAQYGMTGEAIQKSLHDSPEAIAFRTKPPAPTHPNPLIGKLYARNGIIYDQTGPRMVQFCSDFPLIRVFHDDRAKALASLDSMVKAGRHGARIFYALAETEDQNDGFWRGAHVDPYTHTQPHLIEVADEFKSRSLKLHLSGGFNFGSWNKEREFLSWMANTLKDAGHAETVGLFEWRNEFNLTSPWGDGYVNGAVDFNSETYRHGREAIDIFKSTLGCLTTMGSPGEDDDAIAVSVMNSDVASIDFSRGLSGPLMMKHAHRGYYDGRYHGKYKGRALWVTEPTGPNEGGGDVYLPIDDKTYLYGLHAIYALTGQAVSYFSGPSVRDHYPIDTGWGFYELPKLLKFLPNNIGEWNGPTWFVDGSGKFVTVLAEEWGLHTHPDHPIKSWQLQTFDGSIREGTGPISTTGWGAAIIKGEW